MSELFDSLEEDIKAAEAADVEIEEEDKPEKPEEEPEPAPAEEDKPSEETKPEEDHPEPKDDSAWAKYRREKRELEAENKRIKQELENAKQPPVIASTPANITEPATIVGEYKPEAEPDKEKDLAGWLVWNANEQKKWRDSETVRIAKEQETSKINNLVISAKQEIDDIQETYRKNNPDYDNALNHAKVEFTRAQKLLNPRLSDAQIKQEMDKEIFNIALECNKRGMNLGEVLYDLSIERFGYQKNGEITDPSKTPNLKIISNNKKKSASSLDGGGQKGAARVTLAQAAEMSPGELRDLSADDWNYLRSQGF